MKKLLLSLLGILIALPIFSQDFEYAYEGQTIAYTILDRGAKTCKTEAYQHGLSGDLVLPESPNGYKLVEIGDNSFIGCEISSITLPNTIISIGVNAFYCPKLTSITIPNSVTSIGGRAFADCFSLQSIVLSDNLRAIEDGTFSTCQKLTSINIPNSVTSIGNSAFYGCI